MSAHWRRQGVLVLIAGLLFSLAWSLVGATADHAEPVRWLADGTPTYAYDAAAVRRLTWALAAAGVATAAALAVALVHVTRVLMMFKGERHGHLG